MKHLYLVIILVMSVQVQAEYCESLGKLANIAHTASSKNIPKKSFVNYIMNTYMTETNDGTARMVITKVIDIVFVMEAQGYTQAQAVATTEKQCNKW